MNLKINNWSHKFTLLIGTASIATLISFPSVATLLQPLTAQSSKVGQLAQNNSGPVTNPGVSGITTPTGGSGAPVTNPGVSGVTTPSTDSTGTSPNNGATAPVRTITPTDSGTIIPGSTTPGSTTPGSTTPGSTTTPVTPTSIGTPTNITPSNTRSTTQGGSTSTVTPTGSTPVNNSQTGRSTPATGLATPTRSSGAPSASPSTSVDGSNNPSGRSLGQTPATSAGATTRSPTQGSDLGRRQSSPQPPSRSQIVGEAPLESQTGSASGTGAGGVPPTESAADGVRALW